MVKRRRLSATQNDRVSARRQRSLRALIGLGEREGPCLHCACAGGMEWARDDADPTDGGGWVRAYFLRCHMCELWVRLRVWQRGDPTPRFSWGDFDAEPVPPVHESGRHMTLSWVEARRG